MHSFVRNVSLVVLLIGSASASEHSLTTPLIYGIVFLLIFDTIGALVLLYLCTVPVIDFFGIISTNNKSNGSTNRVQKRSKSKSNTHSVTLPVMMSSETTDESAFDENGVKSDSDMSRQQIKCPVCYDNHLVFEVSGRHLVSTKCGHLFCDRCIEAVLKTTKLCPNCRTEMATENSYHPIYI